MKHFITFLLLLTVVSTVDARRRRGEYLEAEYPRWRIGVEAGNEIYEGNLYKPSSIRETQTTVYYGSALTSDDDYYGCGFISVRPDYENWYFGLKTSYSITNQLEIGGGLRAKFGSCTLKSDRDFFLWKTTNSETATNYVRINEISQRVVSLGIPLEAKWIIPRTERPFVPFVSLGISNNFYLTDNMKVDFRDEGMKKYQKTVEKAFPTIDKYYAQVIFGAGFKIRRRNQPFGTFSFQVPVLFNSQKIPRVNSLFELDTRLTCGFQATLYIPFGKKKLIYKY